MIPDIVSFSYSINIDSDTENEKFEQTQELETYSKPKVSETF